MKELIDEAAEEDEETREWEQEQLRRGGHRTLEQGTSTTKEKPIYKPAPIPAMTPIPTLAPAIERLSQRLVTLTTSHGNNTVSLNSLAKEREDVNEKEKEMRMMIEKAEEKRAWFSGFRDWIEGMANFLDSKYPLLEKLEEEHVSLLQERSDMIVQRRRADDEDDLATLFGPLPDADLGQSANETDKSTPLLLSKRERRLARIARRQLRRQSQKANEEEGYSTDSSLPPSDALAYDDAIKSLASRKKEILSDVKAEEFRNPEKGRWDIWREKYTDSYVGAWGGLGVVSVWEFWARLESIGWDCIESSRSLDSFKWYKTIYEYTRPGSPDVEERELGPDGDLVASMISSAIIPRLRKLIEGGALDVYSTRHIRRMVHLAEELDASVEEGNAKLQMLLRSTLTRFESAIADTETLVSIYKSTTRGVPFDPEIIPARRRFLARRVKLLQNLLRWRKHTGERFGIGLLATRFVEGCVIDVALSGWDVGGEEFARQVVSMLPIESVPVRLKRELVL
ncbi:hypothetical protein AX15_002248 [Amanita polypyramis BW_CC]|nr:hypothetical protein AX15_002248 [Amanita polypyramis BW_CC]